MASRGRSAVILTAVKEPPSSFPCILYHVFLLILFDFCFRLNLHQVDADVTFFGFAHKPSGAECTEDKASQFVRKCVCVCARLCALMCELWGLRSLHVSPQFEKK